ncbi:MAG: VanZ family protein [Acetatifactor sp.]|nr:VanZ family protein [Acetatifactor sp.]
MLKYLISDMIDACAYLPAGIFGMAMSYFIIYALNKTEDSKFIDWDIFHKALLVGYICVVAMLTLVSREGGSRTRVDLNLFATWGINARNNAYVVENVLMFIPLGYIVPRIFAQCRRWFLIILIGAASSCFIESMQNMTGRGFFQTDDIVTNTMGMFIGYLCFLIIFRKFSQK